MRLREWLPAFPSSASWINSYVDKDALVGTKPILLFVWSVSCPSCEGTAAWVERLQQKYEGRFHVVGIHMPRMQADMNLGLIKEKASRLGMTYPILVDNDSSYTRLLGNQTVPNFYLFDKKGSYRHRQSGDVGLRILEQRLITLINELA